MILQNEDAKDIEDVSYDGFCDISDENISEEELNENNDSDSKVKKEFQKFINKISQPS